MSLFKLFYAVGERPDFECNGYQECQVRKAGSRVGSGRWEMDCDMTKHGHRLWATGPIGNGNDLTEEKTQNFT